MFEAYYGQRDEDAVFGFGANGDGPFGICGPGSDYGVSSIPHGFLAVVFAFPPVWLLAVVLRLPGYSVRRAALLYAGLIAFGLLMCNLTGRCVLLVSPVAAFFALAAYVGIRLARIPSLAARRLAAGLCPACGYDLRATPGRCPECGAEMNHLPAIVGEVHRTNPSAGDSR